jgi:hypothetical protein
MPALRIEGFEAEVVIWRRHELKFRCIQGFQALKFSSEGKKEKNQDASNFHN